MNLQEYFALLLLLGINIPEPEGFCVIYKNLQHFFFFLKKMWDEAVSLNCSGMAWYGRARDWTLKCYIHFPYLVELEV